MINILLKINLLIVFILTQQYNLIWEIKKQADFIALDRLGFLYLYENNNLYHYNPNGKSLNIFNNRTNGKISSFDASDPYMLLLYYKDLNRIVFLDNQLAPIGTPIDLDKYNLYQVKTVCKSKNFAVWIYDDFDNRLIHYGFNPKGITGQINLSSLNLNNEIRFMREYGNHLYASTGKELLIFDVLGTFIQKSPIEIPNSFQIINNKVIYYHNNQLLIYLPELNQTDTLTLGIIKNAKNVLLTDKRIIVRKENSVSVFSEIQP